MKTDPFKVACYKWQRDNFAESQHYMETWEDTRFFCPNCGEKTVWVEGSPGDYYVGPSYLCSSCSHGFNLPSETGDFSANEQDKQRLAAIRASLNKPTP